MTAAVKYKRIIGKYGNQNGGATMICVGGIHGNEPAGITAIENVLKILRSKNESINGEFIGIAGNLTALTKGKRFIDVDLNRIWTQSSIKKESNDLKNYMEFREQQELLAEIENIVSRSKGKIYFIDLHTSGANGKPFACIGDNLRNRDFALKLPIPIILGLEEQLDGALLEYVNNLGAVTVGVEGGQHETPNAVEYMTSILFLALVFAGMLRKEQIIDFDRRLSDLSNCSKGIPKVLEVRHRHGVTDRSKFEMMDGYKNFQTIQKGELLSVDHNKDIYAAEKGRILLPLYQALGNDGFFITREVNRFWLSVSKLLRNTSLNRILHLLPGVKHYAKDVNKLVIDTKIARWFATEVFHLFGYRKIRVEGGKLTIARRK